MPNFWTLCSSYEVSRFSIFFEYHTDQGVFDGVLKLIWFVWKIKKTSFCTTFSFINYQSDKICLYRDYCRTHTFYRQTFYVAIKIFRLTKCPAYRKSFQAKSIFDFFLIDHMKSLCKYRWIATNIDIV